VFFLYRDQKILQGFYAFGLQQLNVGMATEAGIAIVLLAIIFDRITQSYGDRIQEKTKPKKMKKK